MQYFRENPLVFIVFVVVALFEGRWIRDADHPLSATIVAGIVTFTFTMCAVGLNGFLKSRSK